ncbi:unnamed protein product [Dracunculus medinensis]|uniref:EF-hand domain-containing protein n=1 Tax=Dracunculus medinensis TaxID=318479 RepID=A0A0N4UQ37_DRAME|nr:unnamed protein product [Dracunculus medinensis]
MADGNPTLEFVSISTSGDYMTEKQKNRGDSSSSWFNYPTLGYTWSDNYGTITEKELDSFFLMAHMVMNHDGYDA